MAPLAVYGNVSFSFWLEASMDMDFMLAQYQRDLTLLEKVLPLSTSCYSVDKAKLRVAPLLVYENVIFSFRLEESMYTFLILAQIPKRYAHYWKNFCLCQLLASVYRA